MDNIQELYQEMILEHNRNPRNFKVLEAPTHTAHGINPLCGDDYHVDDHRGDDHHEDCSQSRC